MEIVIVTKMGRIIKFDSKDAPRQSKGGQGTKAITMVQGDEVASAFPVEEKISMQMVSN